MATETIERNASLTNVLERNKTEHEIKVIDREIRLLELENNSITESLERQEIKLAMRRQNRRRF